jgi:hypothetical protein
VSQDALPSFANLSKIGPDFIKKAILKLMFPKNHFNKKSASELLMKKIRKICLIPPFTPSHFVNTTHTI